MKKILLVLLTLVFVFSLVACDDTGEKTDSVSDEVKSAVRGRIIATVALQYDTTGSPNITFFVDEIGDNIYEVTGKVTVRDKYGDSYTGKYDAEVEYNPEDDDCNVTSFDLGTLYKN